MEKHRRFCQSLMAHEDTVQALTQKAKKRMSAAGGAIRQEKLLEDAYQAAKEDLQLLEQNTGAAGERRFIRAYRLRDILICQRMYLFAMLDYVRQGNKSRGSSLYYDAAGSLRRGLEENFRFCLDDGRQNGTVQEVAYSPENCAAVYRSVRPLPKGGGFFENVWRTFRENQNIE